MSFAQNGEIQIFYEGFGRKGDQTVLLLSGAGRQGIDFSDDFCQRVADAGYRAIRFDARDTGWSTNLVHRPSRLVEVFDAVHSSQPLPIAYTLEDMAADAFAVLDAEGVANMHLVGRSLGSAVAQTMALSQPERILTLTLVIAFSRSLADTLKRERLVSLEAETTTDLQSYTERQVRSARSIGSPAYFDEARIAGEARVAFARGVHSGGLSRHFAVGIAAQDLRPKLRMLRIPTLVIHGALDAVIPLAYAEETVAAIGGARLEVIQDMAHDGPPELLARWIELILAHLPRRESNGHNRGGDARFLVDRGPEGFQHSEDHEQA